MSCFNGIKVGDIVWSFEYDWGKVISINEKYFKVEYTNSSFTYNYSFDGILLEVINKWGESIDINLPKKQTLFWDEIKFEIPKKQKIELNKCNEYAFDLYSSKILKKNTNSYDYLIGDGNPYENKECSNSWALRNDINIAESASKQIKRFARLLALRDQECEESRGYDFQYGEINWFIEINENGNYFIEKEQFFNKNTVYFKTEEDAQKICNILNEGRFDLEEV